MRTVRFSLLSFFVLSVLFAGFAFAQTPKPLPEARWDKLPRWRGFNLLEKFMVHSNKPFVEDDFRMIRDLGFNFVRLPMDYRCWIVDGDWERFDEKTLKEIDEAVALGEKYGIHVMLNFHRAPGYTVAQPPEKTSLWTDRKTQEVCAKHWALFAKRYKGIPNSRLSFNLFNEPSNIDEETYAKAAGFIINAIRKEDPERLIVSDGLNWGGKPFSGAKELRIALATRGYSPFQLTHYRASWAHGSDTWPVPKWPMRNANGLLFGSFKKGQQAPMVIEGPFDRDTTLRFHLNQVSTRAVLSVKADGKTLWEKDFVPKDGEGEWSKVVYRPEWNCYQNIYDKTYETVIPKETKRVEIAVAEGDWLTLSKIALQAGSGPVAEIDLVPDWSAKAPVFRYDAQKGALDGGTVQGREFLQETAIAPWVAVEKTGVGVMVGEFGSYDKTPHDVTLAWMEDCLKNWQDADWGWALWNFRGSFGVLDSGRADVNYEDFHGRKLDRKMLELLQKY